MSRKQNTFFNELAKNMGIELSDSEESLGSDDSTYYSSDYESETEEDREWAEKHIITGDEEWDEEWTRSTCTCNVCRGMNDAVDRWDDMKNESPASIIGMVVMNGIDKMVDGMIDTVDDEHFKRGRPTPKL